MVDLAVKSLSLAFGAARINFFGLVCPAHRSQPLFAAVGLAPSGSASSPKGLRVMSRDPGHAEVIELSCLGARPVQACELLHHLLFSSLPSYELAASVLEGPHRSVAAPSCGFRNQVGGSFGSR